MIVRMLFWVCLTSLCLAPIASGQVGIFTGRDKTASGQYRTPTGQVGIFPGRDRTASGQGQGQDREASGSDQSPSEILNRYLEVEEDDLQDSEEEFLESLNEKFLSVEDLDSMNQQYKSFLDSQRASSGSFISRYLPTNTNSTECQMALRNLKLPANLGFTIAMMDSWGKTPDGILWGNYRPLGMFEQCMSLRQASLQGQYCYIMISKSQDASEKAMGIPNEQLSITFGVDLNIYKYLAYGTCIPKDCSEEDMMTSLSEELSSINSEVVDISCQAEGDEKTFTAGDIALLVYLGIMAVVFLAATGMDVYLDATGKEMIRRGPLRFLLLFSVSTNLRKLFHVSSTPPKGSISCLHGFRVLSMIWVIYGHQYIFTLTATMNLMDLGNKTDGFLYQIFANATFSVDSFFFVSGLLVGFLTIKNMANTNGKLNLIMFYVHRYLRLTPAIAMTAWFQATLSRFLVYGPYSHHFDQYVNSCRKNWWTDVLYIDNYAVSLTDPNQADCIAQAWYTAADTQIFIFTPLVLIPLYHYKTIGKVWLAFVTLVACIIPASITVGLDFPPFEKLNMDADTSLKYWRYMYAAPFSRAGPYLVGIGLGYFFAKRGDKPIRLKKWLVSLGWFLSTALALTLLFGIYNYNVLGEEAKDDYTVGMQFFYGGFSRTLWAVSMAWIVFACHYGYGGPANWVLSHPSFQPLSRLTYTMFLMALGIQNILTFSNKQYFYFNHMNKIIETCGTLFIVGIAAVFLSILVEVPLINLEKEILRRPRPSKPPTENGLAQTHPTENVQTNTHVQPIQETKS